MKKQLLIGVDGGGTHSKVIAIRADGQVLGRTTGPGINYNIIGMDVARQRLYDIVGQLLCAVGEDSYDFINIGMSALDGPADEELVRNFAGDLFDHSQIDMDSDAFVALMGATMGEPGVMVISGTGAMVIALDEHANLHKGGGWGYLLEDPGSAYGIAVQAIKAVLAYWEESGPDTCMAQSALAFFQAANKQELLDSIYRPNCDPSQIAQFAKRVITDAEADDTVAKRIINDNIQYLVNLTHRMLRYNSHHVPVYLHGGMFNHNGWIAQRFEQLLHQLDPDASVLRPGFSPEIGAVVATMKRRGILSKDVIGHIEQSIGRNKDVSHQ